MGIKTNEDLEADYVIVGGGTSGIVLAARLSEDDSKSVIIREAGRSLADDFRVQAPALWTTLLGSEADWQLITAPQTELRNRIIKEPQGKLLGGSSGINGQTFIGPSRLRSMPGPN
ncbi:hypothetical protein AFGD_005809 [Aspergillus flavus]|nr:hypothetical protein AFGD_005809 [Aspergillus flavus]